MIEDSNGRVLKLKKLSPLDRLHIFEAAGSALCDNSSWLGYALIASSVTAINTQNYLFPRTKGAVEAMVTALGDEGMEAASEAYRKNFVAGGESGDLEDIRP